MTAVDCECGCVGLLRHVQLWRMNLYVVLTSCDAQIYALLSIFNRLQQDALLLLANPTFVLCNTTCSPMSYWHRNESLTEALIAIANP